MSILTQVDARLSEDLSIYMNTDNRVQDALQMLGDHATHVAGELDRMDTENTRKRYDLLMDQENLKTEPPSQLKVSKASATHASSGLEAHPRLHLTFGGSFAEEVSRDMLQYEDLYEEIARATQLLQVSLCVCGYARGVSNTHMHVYVCPYVFLYIANRFSLKTTLM
jgi:hypothetical protein